MTSETPTLRISEIFGPTVQGEGALIGRPTVFVRTGGCGYRCAWCDTPYAVLPAYRDQWRSLDHAAVLAEVERLAGGPILVTVSGPFPAASRQASSSPRPVRWPLDGPLGDKVR